MVKFTKEELAEAWRLRQKGCYSMREIADKIGYPENRVELIEALEEYLKELGL